MPSPAGEWGTFLETTLVSIMDSADEGIMVFDTDATCRMMGKRVGEFFGVDPKVLVGKLRPEIVVALSAACEDPTAFLTSVAPDDLTDNPSIVSDVELKKPHRTVTWATHPILASGRLLGRLILIRDVTRERNAERAKRHLLERIEQLTHIDALTGLSNRRRFCEEHEREHGRAMRAWDTYAVLRIDVDGMLKLNEAYGGPVGDQVLERVAEIARSGRREYDVVARWEDDEFAVLLPGADVLAARAVAQRIHAALDTLEGASAGAPKVTACIGGAVCVPPTGETADDVMRRAHVALDRARERGPAQVEVDAPPPAEKTTAK